MALNFAVIGVAGSVVPRHLKAIHDTGNRQVAATDPRDFVGILDRYSLDWRFFPEIGGSAATSNNSAGADFGVATRRSTTIANGQILFDLGAREGP